MLKEIFKFFFFGLLSKYVFRLGKMEHTYITFDDGPHSTNTPILVDILSQHSVPATFFMTGSQMLKHPDIVTKVLQFGHQIGYHGFNHTSQKEQSLLMFLADLKRTQELEERFEIKLDLYRPPYGDLSVLCFLYLILNKWKVVMWSLDSRDSFDSEEQIMRNIAPTHIKPGDILLFHDDSDKTTKLLPSILENYRSAGLQNFTTY